MISQYNIEGMYSVTYRAVEALGVVVVVHGLHPLVSGLDREVAGSAHGLVQLAPVCTQIQGHTVKLLVIW